MFLLLLLTSCEAAPLYFSSFDGEVGMVDTESGNVTILAQFLYIDSQLLAKDDSAVYLIGTLRSSEDRGLFLVSTSGVVRRVVECWIPPDVGYMSSLSMDSSGTQFFYFWALYGTGHVYYYGCDTTTNSTQELYHYSSSSIYAPSRTQYYRQNSTTSLLIDGGGSNSMYSYGLWDSSSSDMQKDYCDFSFWYVASEGWVIHEKIMYFVDNLGTQFGAIRLTDAPSDNAVCEILFQGLDVGASTNGIAYRDGFIYYYTGSSFSKMDLASNQSQKIVDYYFYLFGLAMWDPSAVPINGSLGFSSFGLHVILLLLLVQYFFF